MVLERYKIGVFLVESMAQMNNFFHVLVAASKFDYTDEQTDLYEAYAKQYDDRVFTGGVLVTSNPIESCSKRTASEPNQHQRENHRFIIEAPSVLEIVYTKYSAHMLKYVYASEEVWFHGNTLLQKPLAFCLHV